MEIIITAIGRGDAFYGDRQYIIGKKAKAEGLGKDGNWYFGKVTFEKDPLLEGIPRLTCHFAQIKYRRIYDEGDL
jgi:hypothetical protein